MEIKLKSGKILKCVVLAKALVTVVVRTIEGKYLLVSRDEIQEPDDLKVVEKHA